MSDAREKKRILVVEDEKVVAQTLVKIFLAAGYDALEVDSAEAALAMLNTVAWSPDFSLIDVSLPGMNGIDLAIRLNTEHPRGQITLFSGQASTAELLEKAERDGHRFEVLAKPVHPTEFLTLICHSLPHAKFDDADDLNRDARIHHSEAQRQSEFGNDTDIDDE